MLTIGPADDVIGNLGFPFQTPIEKDLQEASGALQRNRKRFALRETSYCGTHIFTPSLAQPTSVVISRAIERSVT